MERRSLRSLLSLAVLVLLVSCGSLQPVPPQEGPGASRNRQLAQQRQAEAKAQVAQRMEQERCLRERSSLESQMADLRRAEVQLARVKQDRYVPLPAPEPWDEATEARYRLEDREADWQRHRQAQEAWQRREQSHRASWKANYQARLQLAQERLDRQARQLRTRRPELFTGPGSIEFNPEVAHRLLHC